MVRFDDVPNGRWFSWRGDYYQKSFAYDYGAYSGGILGTDELTPFDPGQLVKLH